MMIRAFVLILALVTLSALPLRADVVQTSAGAVQVERVVSGLSEPWAIAFLPDGDLLISERAGRLLRIGGGQVRAVSGLPEVFAQGQGGLLDVVVARDHAISSEIFLTYAMPTSTGAVTAMAVARLHEDSLTDLRVLFRGNNTGRGGQHFGSRVVEAADGTLFVTVGERGNADAAQDPALHHGSVIRIARDGSVPPGNPQADHPDAPHIWTTGHRNPQGAALDAEGRLWVVEHGARGGDEINLIAPGLNYGWPVIAYGRHYSGFRIGIGTEAPGLEQPKFYWDPSIAPSGMAIYSGRLWPEWRGDIMTGSLTQDHIARLAVSDTGVSLRENLFEGLFGRIRDVREGPDGAIWFVSVADGAAYRVTPAN